MFKDYYQKELRLLRETAVDFATTNPGLAGLLKESSTDPDTERLLEGFAFLTANIHRELDEQFPTFLYSLAQIVCPDYLRPMPSVTLMKFEPKVSLNQTLRVPAGTYVDSRPVITEKMQQEGKPAETCRFRTCLPFDVMPLKLASAGYLEDDTIGEQSSRWVRFRLDFELLGTTLSELRCNRLRLFLSGGFNEAADLYLLLNRGVDAVHISTGQNRKQDLSLDASVIKPVGFDADETLYQRTKTELPAFALLQEYFLFPKKYLFVDIDLSQWQERGDGTSFSLTFGASIPDFPLPPVSVDHFHLHTTPAVNLFEAETEPVLVDHKDHDVRLTVRSENRTRLPIFAIQKAESVARGRRGSRRFLPIGAFNLKDSAQARFTMTFRPSENDNVTETYVSLAFPPSDPPADREVFRATVTCFNDLLPTALEPGEIDQATMSTSELVTFRNLTIPTPGTRPLLRTEALWHLMSDLSLNYMSLASADTLKTLLGHYIPSDSEDERRFIANTKRVDAITAVHVEPAETLYRQSFLRGQKIRVLVRSDYFSGEGDRYLFGCLLDQLFASSSGLNIFTQLVMEDSVSGAEIEWPMRLGQQALL
jgi:type VI secretion system protein ImpG